MSNPENPDGISFDTFEELVFARRAVGNVLGEGHNLLRHADDMGGDAAPFTLNDLLDTVDEDGRPLPYVYTGESERAITRSLQTVARTGPDEATRRMAHIMLGSARRERHNPARIIMLPVQRAVAVALSR